MIPVYAFRNLGAGSDYSVLADTITVSGTGTTTTSAAGPAGGGTGHVGYATTLSVGASATFNRPGPDNNGTPPAAALAAATTAANSFYALGQLGTDPTAGTGNLSAVGSLPPGHYYIPVAATLNAGDLTLNGAGDYIIAINGPLTTTAGNDILLAGGAAAANVFIVINGSASITGSTINAEVVASSGINVEASTVNGKLVATGGAVNFVDNNTVNDFGSAPTFSSPSQLTYDVCVNDPVSYTVTASDPDGTGTTTLSSTALPGTSTQTPPLGPAVNSSVFNWTPTLADVGPHNITYTATDQTGAINTLTVTINVSRPPDLTVGTAPTGAISGTGTSVDPFVICPMDTLNYGVTSSDPDGDLVVVSVSATPNLTHAPTALPNAPALNVSTTATFQPDMAQEGQLIEIEYTSTDNSTPSCVTEASVFVQVTNQPHFSEPGNLVSVQNVCVGDLLQYDVTADDDDGSEILMLDVQGTPTGAIHAPNFTGVDTAAPGGGDILTYSPNPGDPVTSRFEWTPLPQDVGTHILTYTATDDLGCTDTLVVTVNVTTRPTIAVNSGGPVAEGDILTACPGQAPLVFTVTGTDPDGDDLTLTAAGVPANLSHSVLPANSVGPAPVSTTATFAPDMSQAGQTFNVTYTVTDEFGCDVDQVVTIFVSNPPVFTSANTVNACVGDSLRIPVSASDADAGDVVTLTSGALPAGATLVPALPVNGNPAATEIVWTPGVAGPATITFTATDASNCTASQTVTINVSNLPTVSATTPTGGQGGTGTAADPYRICVGQTATYTVNANSQDVGENVTVDQSGAPTGLTPGNGTIASGNPTAAVAMSYTPDSSQGGQVITVTYTATDTSGAACTATTTVTFEVSNPPVFVEPTATTLNACAGSPVTYTVRATDADPGDVITLSNFTALPAGATVTPVLPTNGNPASTTFSWTPAAAGSFPVTYRAIDASGCSVDQVVTVNVSNLPTVAVNGLAGGLGGAGTAADPRRICVGQSATYTVNAGSGDVGENVTLSVTGAPAGLSHVPGLPVTGTTTTSTAATFTPGAGLGGQVITVTYTATDASGGACTATTTVTFQVSNPPDVTVSQSVVDICVGQSAQFQVRATDADPGIVNLSQTGAPASLTFAPTLPLGGNPVATVATFTPTAADAAASPITVTFTGTDAEGCTDTATVILNVSQPPTVAILGATGAMHGSGTAADPYVLCPPGTGGASTLTYTVSASDPDVADSVTLTSTGKPAAATHTPDLASPGASGVPGAAVVSAFSYTATAGDAGQTFTIEYTAADDSSAACTATETVVIRVDNLPQITASQNTVNICVGQTATFRVRATDVDGGIVTLSNGAKPASLVLSPSLPLGGNPVETVATFTPVAGDAGTTNVTFTATDTDGCSQTTVVTLNVSQVPTVAVSGVAGAPGAGTAADPYVVCPPGTAGASTLTYTVTGADADATQTVTLSETGSPAGATYSPDSLPHTGAAGAAVAENFSFTPTAGDAGQVYTITYTATDNSAAACNSSTTVVIRVANLPQFDGSTPADGTVFNVCTGQNVNFRVHASDADAGDAVTLSQSGGLAGFFTPSLPATGNPVESVFNWTPGAGAPSTSTLVFTATDKSGCAQTRTIIINVSKIPTVAVSAVSGAPGSGTAADPYVVCPPGTAGASTIAYTVTAADADTTQTVTLSETGSPAGATYSPDSLPHTGAAGAAVVENFSFTPAAGDAGNTYTITYTATDNSAAACNSSTTVVIRVANLPQFDGSTPADGTVFNVCTGQNVNFRVHASDADAGDAVTLSQSGGLAGFFTPSLPATGNPVESVFNWTPGAGAPSTSTLVFTATDKSGCAQTRTIIINVSKIPTVAVSAVSGAPGAGTAADPYVVCPPGTAGASTLTYTVTGADADAGDVVTLSESGSPANGTYSPNGLPDTGNPVATNFSFTPTAGQAGQTFTVTYTALDNSGAACSSTATVVIRVSNLPQFTAPSQTTYNVCAGSPLSFTVRATDEDDDDTVTLTSSTLPAGATLTPSLVTNGNPVEAQFNWTPSTNGTSTVTFIATDDSGCAQSLTVTINVSAVPTVAIGNVTGAQHGVGTQADPLVVCATPAAPLTFQVTGSDADAGQTVNITPTGMPSGATFNTTGTNPTVGTFSFSPTFQQGGQTYAVTFNGADNSPAGCNSSVTVYIRVSALPVITATPNNLVLCEGQDINFRVHATDTDVQHVTLTGPSIVATPGAPALNLTHTPSLPMSGNSVETVVVGKSPIVTANATYTLTYTATDEDGCVSTTTVTIQVMETPPTTVVLTRNADGDPFGEEICYTATVFDNCPESEGGPRRVPGVPVLFTVTGETGNNQVTTIITDANGEAKLCITPRFPGALNVSVGIDLDQNGVADPGTTTDSDSVTVPAPVQDGAGCFINGRGSVSVENPLFGDVPLTGQFTLNVSPKRGKLTGGMTFTVVGGGVTAKGKRTNVTVRAIELESMNCGEDATGRHAVLFGQATVKGMSDRGINGTVPFRVDLLDAGTAGTPGDRFVLTFLNQTTNLPVGPLGGNLDSGRGNRKPAGDVSIRMGIRK